MVGELGKTSWRWWGQLWVLKVMTRMDLWLLLRLCLSDAIE